MDPVIIIGSGLAAYTLAKEIRKLDADLPLHLITADDGSSYSKPMLSNALSNGKTPEMLVTANAGQMAEQLKATIWTRTKVTDIEADAHRLTVRDETLAYQKLVLAVGAEPIRPPLEGDGAEDVISVNNIDDYSYFRTAIESRDRIGIIGPGLIGCEFANDLVAAGKQVSVIGPDKTPISTLLPEAAGHALQQALADAGVEWHLGVVAECVMRVDNGYRLLLSDGSQVEVGAVLSAIGLRPNTLLAKQAGLKVNRGVVVNRQLQTSQVDIFALGDCAEVDGLVLPFVMPIMHAARALAKTMTGTATEVSYPAMPVVIKTPAYPVVVSPPAPGAEGEWHIEIKGKSVRALCNSPNDELLGFVLGGDVVKEKQALTRELPPVLA